MEILLLSSKVSELLNHLVPKPVYPSPSVFAISRLMHVHLKQGKQ